MSSLSAIMLAEIIRKKEASQKELKTKGFKSNKSKKPKTALPLEVPAF